MYPGHRTGVAPSDVIISKNAIVMNSDVDSPSDHTFIPGTMVATGGCVGVAVGVAGGIVVGVGVAASGGPSFASCSAVERTGPALPCCTATAVTAPPPSTARATSTRATRNNAGRLGPVPGTPAG